MTITKTHAKTPTTRRKALIAGLITLALLITSAWLIYRDTSEPPLFKSENFKGLNLQQSAQKIADATVAGGAPGVIVLIRKDGREYSAAAGVANKRSGQSMSTELPLRAASISKVYTAAVVMSLVDQKLIHLDTPIADYLNTDIIDGLPNAKQATVRQLLLHTSGIPDYYDLRSYFLQDWSTPITLERTLPVSKRGTANFTPGDQFEYSNMGYILLGEIAEVVSGKTLEELIGQTVIQPLNFTETFYNVQHPVENGIHGYGTYFRPWADTYSLWEHSGPDAGIMAPASEIAQFLEDLTFESGNLRHIGQQILSEKISSGRRRQQALGLEIIETRSGGTLIGHTGDAFGYQTVSFSIPELNTVFVASLNCDCSALTLSLIRNLYVTAQEQSTRKEAEN